MSLYTFNDKTNPLLLSELDSNFAALSTGQTALTGTVAPTSVQATFIGQIYVNTAAQDIYMSYAIGIGAFKKISP